MSRILSVRAGASACNLADSVRLREEDSRHCPLSHPLSEGLIDSNKIRRFDKLVHGLDSRTNRGCSCSSLGCEMDDSAEVGHRPVRQTVHMAEMPSREKVVRRCGDAVILPAAQSSLAHSRSARGSAEVLGRLFGPPFYLPGTSWTPQRRGISSAPPMGQATKRVAMSWQAVTWVLEKSEAELGSRLVLLSIASHANREGLSACPSYQTICLETRMSEREVRYCVRALEESGELHVERGVGRGNPNRYSLPFVAGWVRTIQAPGGKYETKGQKMPHLGNGKGATGNVKGAIYDNKRGNDFDVNPEESSTSLLQPLVTVKDITVKSLAESLSVPRTVKNQEELRAERDRQLAAMKEKGYLQ